MLERMIERLQRLFRSAFESEEESKESVSQLSNPSKPKRVEEARVIYQYPKQGKFRFPVIKDEEPVSTVRLEKEEKSEEIREIHIEKDKWFSAERFQRTEVPSPIYGLRREKVEQINIEETREKTNPFIHSETEIVKYDEEVDVEVEDSTNKDDVFEEELHRAKEEVVATEVVTEENEEKIVGSHEEKQKENIVKNVDKKKSEKRPIPYNVIMLPEDWIKNKKVAPTVQKNETYSFPTLDLLNETEKSEDDDSQWMKEQGELLEQTLQSFHVEARVVHVTKGPTVTRFEIQPGRGVKVNKVTALVDDIKLALAAKDIRIEAPIPGKNTIGIEVPNRKPTPVLLRDVLKHDLFKKATSPLTVALGLDISGKPIITDLKKMPHGLVAGATGSGKSVCINSVLISLLFKATHDDVRLLLIDPKMVELAPYNDIPHLVTPVITDPKQATLALKWTVGEMERRYELFSKKGVRDLDRFNTLYPEEKMPYILVVIDELADLMMVSPQDVEESIARIAQKARACGIHLLLATQRPSVDVITGLIKANIPTRIAFSVSSQTDSRTILDMGGAERLLGRGDMLFHENGTAKPIRLQGTFVSDDEIDNVISTIKKQQKPNYLFELDELKRVTVESEIDDEYFEEACYYVIEQGSASASMLQRKFRIGYNRAARLIDMMEEKGIVSEAMGSKPRHVLIDENGLESLLIQEEK